MDNNLLLIPLIILLVGGFVMVFLTIKGKHSQGKARSVMTEYVRNEIPILRNTNFDVINLLDNSLNAQHIWVFAYNLDGMYLIPTTTNPFTQTMKRYEGETHYNLTDFMPYSGINTVTIDRNKKRIEICIGDISQTFRYQNKDCYGATQEKTIEHFFNYLEKLIVL
ncbi:hypothetical protein H0A36_23595 [Endozoicomonas sp. SM1973]|uniref:Uncharacterized protein n=1 Tax=Spartinivicinus marinus TaxID=2994442 RepID=A0A853I855_9GAMM|nr:hypothetical protein [Spartinivicinus marinus]MCX4026033.1 hypothetical protein [Spartinivicinus marinus]NYZ69009.1 hypothetical protein [Spartinivicinus marinus]